MIAGRVIAAALVVIAADLTSSAPCVAEEATRTVEISPVAAPADETRRDLSLDAFYQKHASVGPFSVVSSEHVADAALLEAAWLIRQMIGHRPDILQALADSKTRFSVMAVTEFTTDIPEHHDLRPADYWDRRARGVGATDARPVVSCGEENLLKYEGDPYATENILIHEFGHAIHEMGLSTVDSEFDSQLLASYEAAIRQGLWKGTYAASNRMEYWAEGVQSWFDTNRQNDRQHNHVDTRSEITDYDPRLAGLLKRVFGNGDWRYTAPSTRRHLPHLQAYDPNTAPRFSWPTDMITRYDAFQMAIKGGDLKDNDRWSDVKPLDREDIDELRSIRSREKTSVVFVNQRSKPIQLEWINEAGQRKPYGRVTPGDYRLMDTYVGHVWLVTDDQGLALLAFSSPQQSSRARLVE